MSEMTPNEYFASKVDCDLLAKLLVGVWVKPMHEIVQYGQSQQGKEAVIVEATHDTRWWGCVDLKIVFSFAWAPRDCACGGCLYRIDSTWMSYDQAAFHLTNPTRGLRAQIQRLDRIALEGRIADRRHEPEELKYIEEVREEAQGIFY